MTFDNFYPGCSYNIEYATAKAVVERPGEFSPLILCGPCGVGKSHILSAIAHRTKEIHVNHKIVHVSADRYIDELLDSIIRRESELFRRKYCETDMLVMDNFELIEGKEHTQEEILKVFDECIIYNRQIVLSVNGCLQDYNFSQRIISRFHGGIILNMKLPDAETKCTIVNGIAKDLNLELDGQILNYIVDKMSNAAEIKGMLKSIKLFIDITNKSPTIDELKKYLPQLRREG